MKHLKICFTLSKTVLQLCEDNEKDLIEPQRSKDQSENFTTAH